MAPSSEDVAVSGGGSQELSNSSPTSSSSGGAGVLGERDHFSKLLQNNREWCKARLAADPKFFERLCEQQNPEYLWIGCSDSRVPANQILGLQPGEVFVQRNVGNQATHTDLNVMSCLEYSVKELKVKNVIVCGHYGCGAVKAALKLPSKTTNLVNCWISDIRECRNQHRAELMQLDDHQAQVDRLCELNVLRQAFHVATSPVVQAAWDRGQELHLYGVVYSLKDGQIKKLVGPISGNGDFECDQADFESHGATYVAAAEAAAAAAVAEVGAGVGNLNVVSATLDGRVSLNGVTLTSEAKEDGRSSAAQVDALRAYINTAKVNNRIAEHVNGWH
ncbi:hypothetical protein CHLRE_09g405750v5 [Chlamydomonas reinhardtii]|uniref:Carbonic anhydrase n=1 Tax=Chlamydomonas reinhardtii TaxID=3055 RepID=A7UCH9_CHLRE|nr:uncharacterized protein CHLRE_09g405750v5 [Chlamydomonas reinhardtii]ABS87675.1 CAH8 [Chlamydomonas reinhardtii]PNW79196.1 hypothetical protein CHLRE_09g405750v5 [Chlamydomonas reinhardtii]|eukprot:XP_001697606.1 carbonic anhydrase 8 [Chlamydomonas reinhardtii]